MRQRKDRQPAATAARWSLARSGKTQPSTNQDPRRRDCHRPSGASTERVRYEAAMWHAAGLEEPNAKGAKGAEGGADADAEMEVDNLAAGGGFFGWMGREQLGAGAGG